MGTAGRCLLAYRTGERDEGGDLFSVDAMAGAMLEADFHAAVRGLVRAVLKPK